MNWKTLLIMALLMIASAVFARQMFPKIEETVIYEQAQVDENTWVRRSSYESTRSILQTLEGENEQLYNQLRNVNARIANLTSIQGELNLTIDSLKSHRDSVIVPIYNGQVQDTTITFKEFFGDGLFEIESRVKFWSGYLTNDLIIIQKRPLRLHVATTISKDRRQLFTYVSSPDFKNIEYTTVTNVPPQKLKPAHYMLIGAGIATGAYIIFN